MNGNLLLDCLWYADIAPERLAEALEILPEILFKKICQEEEFTESEILAIKDFLGLSLDEVCMIFYK